MKKCTKSECSLRTGESGAWYVCLPCHIAEPLETQESPSMPLRDTETAGKGARREFTPITLELPCPLSTNHLAHAITAVEMEFPLPPTACMPNMRRHWRTVAKAIKNYRSECLALLPCVVGLFRRARISVTFYHAPAAGRYHARDTQNAIAGIKALVDAIIDAGYLPDDGAKYLEWGSVKLLTTAKEHEGKSCVRVRLESLK